jgi:hypothetical protein
MKTQTATEAACMLCLAMYICVTARRGAKYIRRVSLSARQTSVPSQPMVTILNPKLIPGNHESWPNSGELGVKQFKYLITTII